MGTQRKIMEIVKSHIKESQNGFRKEKGVEDHIFIVKQLPLIENNTNDKLCVGFLDIEKVFNSVSKI